MPNVYDLSVLAANNSATGGMNWAENQAPSTVNNSARQGWALLAQILADIGGTLTAGGTANALTVTANSDFTVYADGRMVSFKASADNTGATTLSVNGIGAKAIRKMTSAGEAALDAADIKNGYTYVVRYSATASGAAGAWLLDWAPKAISLDSVPIGSGMDYWGFVAPAGYLFPYGQAVSRTTYSALFAVMGTTYGAGDGSTTFNLPDKRGRASFGYDSMGGTSANRLTDQTGGINGDLVGDTGGAETHTITADQLPSHGHNAGTLAAATGGEHTHDFFGAPGALQQGTSAGTEWRVNGSAAPGAIANSGAHGHIITGATANTGSGVAHNILPPGIVCNYVIFAGV